VDDGDLTLAMIVDAHRRVRDHIHQTPVMTSSVLDREFGGRLYFKCENLQKTGSFKVRGATSAVLLLDSRKAARGVLTHSSGNHAAALARAAALRGIPAHIVMPRTAPVSKQAAVQRLGGRITLCEPTQMAREMAAARLQETTGATMIHPYDDLHVMAGQGTTALEFLEQVPDLEAIICPVGGGGHLSGIAVAAKSLNPAIRVLGAEPAGAADTARSIAAGRIIACDNPRSIADGLLATVGRQCFSLVQRHVDEIIEVDDAAIVDAMRKIWQIMKLLVEPSGAVGLAAALKLAARLAPMRTGVVLSGGNMDLDRLPWQASMNPWGSPDPKCR